MSAVRVKKALFDREIISPVPVVAFAIACVLASLSLQ